MKTAQDIRQTKLCFGCNRPGRKGAMIANSEGHYHARCFIRSFGVRTTVRDAQVESLRKD